MRIGPWQVNWFEDGRWRMDGGAMFGRVPRVLWEKENPPDEQNRVEVTCRPLLLRGDDGTVVLIDTGLGTTYDARLRRNFAIPDEWNSLDGLAQFDITPDNVSYVVLTHLHFDHVGGAVRKADNGEVVPTFPNARHLIDRGEWELAHSDHPLTRRQYSTHTFDALANAGLVDLTDEGEVLPGVRVETTGGHTDHHQMVLISDSNTTICYPGDAMPLAAHIQAIWALGLDTQPIAMTDSKAEFLSRGEKDDWLFVLNHDIRRATGRVGTNDDGDFVWRD